MAITISNPAKERFLRILRILETPEWAVKTVEEVKNPKNSAGRNYTSAELEILTGWPSHTIRKDISSLTKQEQIKDSEPETAGHFSAGISSGDVPHINDATPGDPAGSRRLGGSTGYAPRTLAPLIKEALGLNKKRTFCIVGLGRLGSAYLNIGSDAFGEFELAAGFDTSVNRVEILKSQVPLFPVYKMNSVIRRLGIEIALLCVPAEAAQNAAEKLAAAGIRGILNFAPVILTLPQVNTSVSGDYTENNIVVRNVYIADELRALAVNIVN